MKANLFFRNLMRRRLLSAGIILFVLLASGAGVYAAIRPHRPVFTPVISNEPPSSISTVTSLPVSTAQAPTVTQTHTITSPTPSNKGYTPFVCTKMVLHYNTVYKDASYMDVGQTSSSGGQDGYTSTCTPDSNGYKPSDYTLPPYDKTVYTGIRQPQAQFTPQPSVSTYTPINAQIYCSQYGNSSAYDQCVYAINQENAKH